MVPVQGIKDRKRAAPLLAGDEAIAVEVVGAEEGLGGVADAGLAFQDLEASLEHLLEGLDGLGEALDALVQLLPGHLVLGMHLPERGLVQGDSIFAAGRGGGGVELAGQLPLGGAQLGEQGRGDGDSPMLRKLAPITSVLYPWRL